MLIALLAVAAVAWLPRHLEGGDDAVDLARVERERLELSAGNTALREAVELLEAEVAALHVSSSDPEAYAKAAAEIQRIAREDLNLIRPGEVVFEFEENEEGTP